MPKHKYNHNPTTLHIPSLGPVLFTQSPRAKHLSITIKPDQTIKVTIPKRVSLPTAKKFLLSKIPWAKKNLNKLKKLQKNYPQQELSSAFIIHLTFYSINEKCLRSIRSAGGRVSQAMQAFRTFLGDSDMTAYLAMMAPRLVELHRVLKPTGSIYLHCDPTASHYLILIILMGRYLPSPFRREISLSIPHP